MTGKLREHLKAVQELQAQCNEFPFTIEVDSCSCFRVIIRYYEDGIRKNKFVDFYEDDDENSKKEIKEIKKIIREQYHKVK